LDNNSDISSSGRSNDIKSHEPEEMIQKWKAEVTERERIIAELEDKIRKKDEIITKLDDRVKIVEIIC
jgi:hypothetical protein